MWELSESSQVLQVQGRWVTKRGRVGWEMMGGGLGGRGWRRDRRVSRLTSAVCLPHLQGPSPVT